MSWFDTLLRKQTPATPTDLLVGMLCQRIALDALTTDQMLVRGYYDSHRWSWREKQIYIDFTTQSYAADAPAGSIDALFFKQAKIDLTDAQKQKLLEAFNTAVRDALARKNAKDEAVNEHKALDAVTAILGIEEL